METPACPKCNSSKRERGEIYPKGGLLDIRFKAENTSAWSLKKRVVAFACLSCGYVELYLSELGN